MPDVFSALGATWLSATSSAGPSLTQDDSVTILARPRGDQGHEDPTKVIADKITRMEERMRALEGITSAFWQAAPERGQEGHSFLQGWQDARREALRTMGGPDSHDIGELGERRRVFALLEEARR